VEGDDHLHLAKLLNFDDTEEVANLNLEPVGNSNKFEGEIERMPLFQPRVTVNSNGLQASESQNRRLSVRDYGVHNFNSRATFGEKLKTSLLRE